MYNRKIPITFNGLTYIMCIVYVPGGRCKHNNISPKILWLMEGRKLYGLHKPSARVVYIYKNSEFLPDERTRRGSSKIHSSAHPLHATPYHMEPVSMAGCRVGVPIRIIGVYSRWLSVYDMYSPRVVLYYCDYAIMYLYNFIIIIIGRYTSSYP